MLCVPGALNAVDALFDGVKTAMDGLELAVDAVSFVGVGLFSVVAFVFGFRMLRIFAWSSACCRAIDCGSVAYGWYDEPREWNYDHIQINLQRKLLITVT